MKLFVVALAVVAYTGLSRAEESVSEKGASAGNSMKRGAKKGMNRAKEMVCTEGDAACLAKKAGHRVGEGADAMGDKAKEGKDKMDSNPAPTK